MTIKHLCNEYAEPLIDKRGGVSISRK